MGGGRKTETIILQKKAPPKWNMNTNPWSARKLAKKELGSVIFGCKHSTCKECIDKQLFGLPAGHFQYVQNVTQGMPLFLFNYSDRKLHGIFEAISAGQWEINPYAWMSNDDESTPYPAQVRVKIRMPCQPLTEDQYQPILAKNYSPHESNHFQFELDESQTHQLIALFSAFPVTRHLAPKWGTLFAKSFAVAAHQDCSSREATSDRSSVASAYNDKKIEKLEAPLDDDAPAKTNIAASFQGKSWSSLFKPQSDSITNNKQGSKKPALELPIPCQNQFSMLWESSYSELLSDGENELCGELITKGTSPEVGDQVFSLIPVPEFADFSDTIDAVTSTLNLDKIALAVDFNGEQNTKTVATDDNLSVEPNIDWVSSLPQSDGEVELAEAPLDAAMHEEGHMMLKPCSEGSNHSAMSVIADLEGNARHTAVFEEANTLAALFSEEMISEMKFSDMQTVVTKLIKTIGEMKLSQLIQAQKIQTLEQELVESKRKIEELRYNERAFSHSTPSLSIGHAEETQFQRSLQDSNRSILLVGGFDGSSWLPDLDSYLPAKDVKQSLEPMISVRSYASAVIFNGGLYVLGGGYGSYWYDTVESYNLKSHQWVSCPSLNRKKGSLAGACLSDKIFAIGGGNATDCFCEVEMLDLNIGKWIYTRSMTQKRFAPAAAEMSGALYVVGGYDGKEYMQSMERFDPRECAWTSLTSMTTRRGCHSLAVLNEKLYAIGGFDGSQIVSTVEVFEPRVGAWMMSEPLKYARAYMGAVILGNSIFAIGGMQENGNILDTVECYCEGEGWSLTNLKSVGKRCFFSAVVP